MDVREKLIELERNGLACPGHLDPFGDHCEACHYYDSKECDLEWLADHLIANGVTVQELDGCEFCADAKWISGQVTASHPRNNGAICNQIDGDFDFCPMCGRKLPEPPKEDAK